MTLLDGDRVKCSVPFCRRTAARLHFPDHEEIICGKHYQLASKVWRRRLAKVQRKRNYLMRRSINLPTIMRLDLIEASLWLRIKKQVIELAVGI